MAASVELVLVVGGGIAGMTLAIGLTRAGIRTEVVELSPNWSVLGMGIALQGPTLRALKMLGVLEPCIVAGFGYSQVEVCNPPGKIVSQIDIPRLAGPAYPAAVGISRAVFHDVLADAMKAQAIPIRLGTTVSALRPTADRVRVTFTDGTEQDYGLVVGADGASSKIRELVFGEIRPLYTGQIVWRATVPKPAEIKALQVVYGGKCKPGVNPISGTEMYVFVVENNDDRTHLPQAQLPELLRSILQPFGGALAVARGQIHDPDQIVRRPITSLLAPAPWHRGRVLLIGDAAHTTTPHMASGAGIAIEDSIVLAELLAAGTAVDETLTRFMARRFERCRMVVENSVQLGEWEKNPAAPGADPVGLLGKSVAALAQPI